MTIRRYARVYVPAICLAALVSLSGVVWADTIPLMTRDELKSRLGDADIAILDVRAGKDWKSSEFKITGALRVKPSPENKWADRFDKSKTYVIYCA